MNLNEFKVILIILCSLYSIINTFHIGVIKKNFIELNGIKIKSNDVHKYLHNHEKILLFGGNKNYQTDIKLVEVKRNKNQRKIRSTITTTPSLVSVQIDDDNGKRIDLKLKQTSRLIDDAFILIKRYENSSQFIEDSHKLAIDYENCFYRNENSALDLCDDNAIRGLFRHNSKNFFIHPLPERFGNNSHIIYKSGNDYQNKDVDVDVDDDNDNDNEDNDDNNDHYHNDNNDYDNETNSNIIYNINKKNLNKFNYKNKNSFDYFYKYDINDNNEYFEPYNIENDYESDKIIIKNKSKIKIKQHINECIHNENDNNNNNNNLIKDNLKKSNLYKENNEKIFENEYYDDDVDDNKNDNEYKNLKNKYIRIKRHISKSKWDNIVPHVLHIETAIFVDRDLYKHMSKNFPKNTENHLIRFVLAMVNGVQLLYHHPSLGYQINFVLKRLEILYSDPKGLRRSSDIDIYLNNFCLWQKKLNPTSDADVVHYDHAVILTGLDLYVVGKNGKVSSQVVGLAPVAGMCTSTSSCTINEGKHFESVFVVAHEIGHNLGMRHDTLENNCDPSLYIMSPTLGSGKITWSKCSRDYLNEFLLTSQARCMFDRGQFGNSLDHSAEGILPGERFDADQQCMLKYGKDSVRSKNQPYTDICHDLHCQRERYTWTSHPALEGTECGEMMWCHSGVCIVKDAETEAYLPLKSVINLKHYDKIGSFIDDDKKLLSNLKHEYNFDKPPTWSEWGEPTNCESGCLYGSSGRLTEGSTGLKTFTRYCLGYKKRCVGRDHKYETCIAKQCFTITKTTVEEFATQICERAKKFDNDLSGEGLQIIGNDVEESCKVYCKTKMNTTKSRSWTYPDGTICYTKKYSINDISYCINGRCEKFSCNTTHTNYFKINTDYCPKKNGIMMITEETKQQWNGLYYQENGRDYKSIRLINRNNNNNNNNKDNKDINKDNSNRNNNNNNTKLYNEDYVNVKIDHINNDNSEINIKQESLKQLNEFQDRNFDLYETSRNFENIWTVKSGCHFSCVENAKGIQIVFSKKDGSKNIQLCSPKLMPCDKIQTTTEFAENICSKYKLKVRGLSGYGMQIQPSIQDPDRSCKVACQDEYLLHRFYLVNGDYGLFPFGTKCSPKEKRYCVNGKCLEFDFNDIPLMQSYISLALFRNKREINNSRIKRSYLYYKPINITEHITQEILDRIIHNIEFRIKETVFNETISDENIQFSDPIHVSFDELVKF